MILVIVVIVIVLSSSSDIMALYHVWAITFVVQQCYSNIMDGYNQPGEQMNEWMNK